MKSGLVIAALLAVGYLLLKGKSAVGTNQTQAAVTSAQTNVSNAAVSQQLLNAYMAGQGNQTIGQATAIGQSVANQLSTANPTWYGYTNPGQPSPIYI